MNKIDRMFGTIMCGIGATLVLLMFIVVELSKLGI